ncbi:Rv2578c family radical SAM protein [Arthrobacter halodurans]|uniref:Rv2578c family radical SAM protein n=1 Tax=Arthrobacter halodurans TaxID=516699 RepID=A0ABV4UN91_9MICC
MRWEAQLVRPPAGPPEAGYADMVGAPLPLAGFGDVSAAGALPLPGIVRSVRTPEFAGMTFHEVLAKSALNKVPEASNMPFRWTVNPYRGCSHACVYCFARKTHTYLDLDAGADFDSQVVVKLNVAEVLRAELRKPSWGRQHVALGTNTDPYQRAEGRYRLMPGILAALTDSGTPFSILTKGTLLARDVDRLVAAAGEVPVSVALSIAMTNAELSAAVEPGTPSPEARFRLVERLAGRGIDCAVLAMPILPWLSDSDEALDALFARLARAGASSVTAGPLHLRPGAREWFMSWLAATHPQLVERYRRLYRRGAVADPEYRTWLSGRIRHFRTLHGLASGGAAFRDAAGADGPGPRAGSAAGPGAGSAAGPPTEAAPGQPALFDLRG